MSGGSTEPEFVHVKWSTPADEVLGVAALVKSLVTGGKDPRHVCIVVPNRNWAIQMQKASAQVGFTTTQGASRVPLMLMGSVEGSFDTVMLLGCVEGLVPVRSVFEADTDQERFTALEASRRAFRETVACATERVVVSSFSKLDATLARQAHVRAARYKMEHGVRLAMAMPTRFVGELEPRCPTTVGGQAFLREYGLN